MNRTRSLRDVREFQALNHKPPRLLRQCAINDLFNLRVEYMGYTHTKRQRPHATETPHVRHISVPFCKLLFRHESNHKSATRSTNAIRHPGLPWGWHFNPHAHPIPTGIPIGIPMGIPIPTEPEVSTLLHVCLPSPIGRFLLFVM